MADTHNSDKTIILKAAPFLWISILVKTTTGTGSEAVTTYDIVKKWTFRNAGNVTYKVLKASSSSSSSSKSEYIDITAGDQMITRFPKESRIIDGLTDTIFEESESATTDSKGHKATGKALITVAVQQAPMECANWTAFQDELEEFLNNSANDGRVLATIGTGYTGYASSSSTAYKPEGFAHIFGKITSDIENTSGASSPTSNSFEISSYEATEIEDAKITAHTFEPILHRRGGGTNDITITPPAITDIAKIAKLKAGRIIYINNSAS